jgi:redox-sensitive bicupin YhaK (pirin superfamily)
MLNRRDALRTLVSLAGVPLVEGCAREPLPAPRPSRPATPSPNAFPALVRGRPSTDGAGAALRRIFPQAPGDHLDPFVLLDDFGVAPPAGFPTHPHRGFEAFTYMLDGGFEHRDNLGNVSTVSTGGVQLFTSGRGARHSEMPARPQINRGLQLWINLPQHRKGIDPRYAAHAAATLPEHAERDVRVRTVVGPQSPVQLETDVRYLDLTLPSGTRWSTEQPDDWQGLLYVVDGQVRVGDVDLARGEGAVLRPGELGLLARVDSRAVWIAGRAHREPIRQHGPYVD